MNRRYLIFIFLFSIFVTSLTAVDTQWYLSPAFSTDNPDDIDEMRFIPIDFIQEAESFLVSDEAWFWLKADFQRTAEPQALLIGGSSLYWQAWLNGRAVAEGGSAPPWWFASSPLLELVHLENHQGSEELLIKVYYRRGFAAWPGVIEIGDADRLATKRILRALRDAGIPIVTFILGLMLGITALSSYVIQRQVSLLAFSAFGVLLSLSRVDTIVSLFPFLSAYLSWEIPAGIAAAALPLALSSWRRSIACSGTESEHAAITIIDKILASAAAVWVLLPLWVKLDGNLLLNRLSAYEPVSLYAGAALSAGMAKWIFNVFKRKPRSLQLLIPLAGMMLPLISALPAGGASYLSLSQVILEYGMPAYLLLSIPWLVNPGSKAVTGRAAWTVDDDAQDPGELEPLESVPEHRADMPDKKLIKILRESLHHSLSQSDPNWDIASGYGTSSAAPAHFYDLYTNNEKRLGGFSFMESQSESLESSLFLQLVKSEVRDQFAAGLPLPRLLRFVHRRLKNASGLAGTTVTGIAGRIMKNRISFLTMANAPMLLRREGENKIILLKSRNAAIRNEGIGSPGFGEDGLQTRAFTMENGDILCLYNRRLTESWEMKRLTDVLKDSEGLTAAGILEKLLKYGPLPPGAQILVMRLR